MLYCILQEYKKLYDKRNKCKKTGGKWYESVFLVWYKVHERLFFKEHSLYMHYICKCTKYVTENPRAQNLGSTSYLRHFSMLLCISHAYRKVNVLQTSLFDFENSNSYKSNLNILNRISLVICLIKVIMFLFSSANIETESKCSYQFIFLWVCIQCKSFECVIVFSILFQLRTIKLLS